MAGANLADLSSHTPSDPLLDRRAPLISHFRVRLDAEMARIAQGRSGAVPRDLVVDAAVAVFEELLHVVAVAVEDENSRLRRELRAVQGARRLLVEQLAAAQTALSVASRSKNGGFRRSVGTAIAGILMSLPGAAVGAGVTVAAEHLLTPADVSASELGAAYASLEDAIDQLTDEIASGDGLPAGDSSAVNDSRPGEDAEDEDEWELADDPWANLQDADGNYRVPWTEDEHAGSMWRDHGFAPDAAEEWASLDFDPSEADRWRRTSLDPEQSAAWRSSGFAAGEAAEWYSELHEDPERAASWRERGYEAEHAWDWEQAGFDPDTADAWYDHGFGSDEAEEWAAAGFEPTPATEWRDIGVEPDAASAFSEAQLSPAQVASVQGDAEDAG
jgi:hypothetical protein